MAKKPKNKQRGSMTYALCVEGQKIADHLVAKEKEFAPFRTVGIAVLQSSRPLRRCLANIRKVSKIYRPLIRGRYTYLIIVDGTRWPKWSSMVQEAVVYHELNHMAVKETKRGLRFMLVHHDIEEFYAVLKKYKKFRPKISQLLDALKS